MKKLQLILITAFLITGCTHASISSIPIEIEGVGLIYKYEGRANFSHQIAKANKLITEDCLKRNGGTPVIVDIKKQDLGMVAIGNANSNSSLNATRLGNSIHGTINTTTTGTTTSLKNTNQEIYYKCVAAQ